MKSALGAVCGVVALAGMVGVVGGCGPSKPKVNYAKLSAVKKVAIVGVCGTNDAAWVDGVAARDRQHGVGASVLPAVHRGFETALPGALGREVVPLTTVAGVADLPKANGLSPNLECAASVSPFVVGGKMASYSPKPDATLLRLMADKLGVDAVVAVAFNFALNTGGDGARLAAGTFNPVRVWMVDRSGEIILQASLKDIDTPKVPVAKDTSVGASGTTYSAALPPGAYDALGLSLGQIVATRLGEVASGTP